VSAVRVDSLPDAAGSRPADASPAAGPRGAASDAVEAGGAAAKGVTSGGASIRLAGFGVTPAGREQPVLAGLDVSVEPGEIVLLAGPSGAGKSTLLQALAGLLQPDEEPAAEDAAAHGVRLLGELSISGPAGRVPGTGLVQQDPETQVVLSRIGDDVAFGAENLGVEPEQIWLRVRAALASVGLGDFPLNHPTAALSGGQKQRLAIAGLLAMRPGLWLLDEPTANLDPDGARELRSVVLRTAREAGATVVLVEHRLDLWVDPEDGTPGVDRLLVLGTRDDGRDEQQGGGPAGVIADGVPARLLGDDEVVASLTAAGVWVPGVRPRLADRPFAPGSTGAPLLTALGLGASRQALPRRRAARRRVTPAVTGVDRTRTEGEAVCLLGRNGAGKTALALTLAGLARAAAGRVRAEELLRAGARWDEPERFSARELVTRIGMVFQDPEHQFVTRSVREELAFSPRRAGVEADVVQARVSGLLQRLHLEQVADANPYTLSGGQQRRLSVGTALAAQPRLLVLDEPTFGQDAITWADLVTLLREQVRAGTAIVAVTHDEAFAQALDARRVLVQDGRAQEVAA